MFNVSSIEYLKIYTYKQLYKPGKVITSVAKKGERNITFVTIISANAFKSNKFFPFKKSKKKKKNISETSYPKTDITENVCGLLTTINECCMLR